MTNAWIWPPRSTPAKRLVVALQRLGLAVGPLHLLSLPDRRDGRMHGTPVAVLTVEGRRYVVGPVDPGWVDPARAGGWAFLGRGRTEERVALHEPPPAERGPLLRRFSRPVADRTPSWPRFFRRPAGPTAPAATAPRWSLFRIERLPAADRSPPARRPSSTPPTRHTGATRPPPADRPAPEPSA